MDTHVRAVAIANIIFGIFAAVMPVAALIAFGGPVNLWGEAEAWARAGFIAVALILLHLVVATPCILGGFGLLRYEEWARVTIVLCSAVNIVNAPFGTLIGAYGLWALTQHESEPLFRNAVPPKRSGRDHLPK